jgi:hypothetical protein
MWREAVELFHGNYLTKRNKTGINFNRAAVRCAIFTGL